MQKMIYYILGYALLNVTGAAIVKVQLKTIKLTAWQDWISFMFNLQFMAAAGCIVVSALFMFKALSESQLSTVIPVATGINFLLTVIIGYFLFQDKLSMLSLLGFLLIFGGILILSLQAQAPADV